MSEDPKAKLYRQIVQGADERIILERMKQLGFWPTDQGLPQDPPAEKAEREQLEREMASLLKQKSTVRNADAALAAERKRRWEESKRRRSENKVRKDRERLERRQRWLNYHKTTIVHVGAGVSGGLQQATSDV